MINIKLEEHLAPLGIVPKSYVVALIPLILYLIYKVSLLFKNWTASILTFSTVDISDRYSSHQRPSGDSWSSARLWTSSQTWR
jgi:hypothetical protein